MTLKRLRESVNGRESAEMMMMKQNKRNYKTSVSVFAISIAPELESGNN